MREFGNFELDTSLLTKKENAEITFYQSNGHHNIKLIRTHPETLKLSNSWGNYLTIRYTIQMNQWYLLSDKGATKA